MLIFTLTRLFNYDSPLYYTFKLISVFILWELIRIE